MTSIKIIEEAYVYQNGKMIKGILEINDYGIVFGNEKKLIYRKSLDWNNLRIKTGKIHVSAFFLIKNEKKYIEFITDNEKSIRFIFDVEISDIYETLKKYIDQIELENKLEDERQETERQRRLEEEGQEAERQRKLEEERQEAERQRKLEEERQEAERQRKLEEERQEAERQRRLEEECQEAERQRRLEEERQEAERQRKLEEERQEAERQRKLEEERQEAERQRKLEEERQEAERQRKLEKERQEAERQRRLEEERQEAERQRRLEKERQEAERKRKVEEERQEAEHQRRLEEERQEAERQRKIEEERQEAEHQRRLEEERQEVERQRKIEEERQEVERQRKIEEERQEVERQRKLVEENDPENIRESLFKELLIEEGIESANDRFGLVDVYDNLITNEYSEGFETIGRLVINYFICVLDEDGGVEAIENNSDLYDEIITIMGYRNVSDYIVTDFEQLINDVEDQIIEIEDIYEFLNHLCDDLLYSVHKNNRDEEDDDLDYRLYLYSDYSEMVNIENQIKLQEIEKNRIDQIRKERVREYKRIYYNILSYIKVQKYPFDKKQIINSVPGANESIVRGLLNAEKKVLNYYRKYIWYDSLDITENDINEIENVLKKVVIQNKTYHIQEVYDQLLISKPDFLDRNMITTSHRLFSVLKVMIKTGYCFDRPYLAKDGVEIKTVQERIEDFIWFKDIVPIAELLEYAKENYMSIGNTLQFLEGLSDTHIFCDKYNLIKYKKSEINKRLAKKIEDIIYDEVAEKGCMGICELTCINKLPEISLEWNEWLLYGILKKWGYFLGVIPTVSTYTKAIPVIYTDYDKAIDSLEMISSRCKGKHLGSAIDVNNVDEIIDDILDDIIDDLEF